VTKYNTAEPILRANGYAPIPIGPTAKLPDGPWAVAQLANNYPIDPDAPACVLTAIPPARARGTGVVEKPAETYLTVVCVDVKPEMTLDVDRVVERFAGSAKVPTRVDSDGERLYVFRNADTTPYVQLSTDIYHRPTAGRVQIDAKASFVELARTWRNGVDLLNTPRDRLAALGYVGSKELIAAFNGLFESKAPPAPPARKPKPLGPILSPGQELLWSNERATERLRENSYAVCPVPWGASKPVGRSWNKPYDDADGADGDGVGVLLALPHGQRGRNLTSYADTWLAAVHVNSKEPEVDDVLTQHLGSATLVRLSSDGTRTYLLRAQQPFGGLSFSRCAMNAGSPVPGTRTTVKVESANSVVVVSGLDEAGKPFRWRGRSPLEVKRADLPVVGSAAQLIRDVERCPGQLSHAAA
jgi:hypothetical protein